MIIFLSILCGLSLFRIVKSISEIRHVKSLYRIADKVINLVSLDDNGTCEEIGIKTHRFLSKANENNEILEGKLTELRRIIYQKYQVSVEN